MIKTPSSTNRLHKEQEQPKTNQIKEEKTSGSYDKENISETISSITINDLVKKQCGTFNTKGTVVSITPIMQAISKISWKCSNEYADANESGDYHDPYNEKIFDTPLMRLDGLKLRCNSCLTQAPDIAEPTVRKEWLNYIIIQAQDDDSPIVDDLQKMTALVYDQDINKVHVGESIKIHGNVRVPLKSYDKPYSGKTINSNLSSVLYAEFVECEDREEIKITEQDSQVFEKFVNYPNLMKRLAVIFAPNVIGHEDKKIAVILAAAGAPEEEMLKEKRRRIHVLFVGPPGTAKTTLCYEALNLLPNSRFTAAQTSSVKTILAIVEVQGDTKIIRYGAIPLAKNAICIIDEVGAMSYEDQVGLFNVMEHGEFPLNKHGESKMISAPTTIIGTSNPKNINASWINSAKASKDEIPLRRALIDRFDIVLVFKDEDTEESANSYALEKIRLSKISSYNYRFLRKYLHHIKSTVKEVSFTKEAEIMIAKYYASVKVNENLGMTNRAFETLTRICKAWARLHLKTIVDTDIVDQVQRYFSGVMLQYGQVIKAAIDPRDLACEEIINVIKQVKSPISFEEAARDACQQNRQVKDYFGPNLKLRDNNKLHDVSERVREYNNNVKVVQIKPLFLEWVEAGDTKTTSNKGGD